MNAGNCKQRREVKRIAERKIERKVKKKRRKKKERKKTTRERKEQMTEQSQKKKIWEKRKKEINPSTHTNTYFKNGIFHVENQKKEEKSDKYNLQQTDTVKKLTDVYVLIKKR